MNLYLQVHSLLNLIGYREDIYYIFGLFCLISWFIFNVWILRDYFFPWWFEPIYTEKGLNKVDLEHKKIEFLLRQRINNAFAISISVAAPSTIRNSLGFTPQLNTAILADLNNSPHIQQQSQILNPVTLSMLEQTV
ncbi:unnamed protein product [Thelazia callipaeda]|uniref:Bestrophin homolog n=1 Tax=Thelazia callipaeda TaxID=103827 RepID=A0A0N5CWH9_THECL|nr:unnamed protein product [Thelazia callipaeda]